MFLAPFWFDPPADGAVATPNDLGSVLQLLWLDEAAKCWCEEKRVEEDNNNDDLSIRSPPAMSALVVVVEQDKSINDNSLLRN